MTESGSNRNRNDIKGASMCIKSLDEDLFNGILPEFMDMLQAMNDTSVDQQALARRCLRLGDMFKAAKGMVNNTPGLDKSVKQQEVALDDAIKERKEKQQQLEKYLQFDVFEQQSIRH